MAALAMGLGRMAEGCLSMHCRSGAGGGACARPVASKLRHPYLAEAWSQPGLAFAQTLIAPLGFCMGMPFPLGLTRVARLDPAFVPWAWGLNGCVSVVSAATLLAIDLGEFPNVINDSGVAPGATIRRLARMAGWGPLIPACGRTGADTGSAGSGGQKQRISASACARRRLAAISRMAGVPRKIAPRSPPVSRILSTVSAST